MVFVRAAAWVWLGVLPVVWCLPLEGVRNSAAQQQQQQHHQQQRHQPLSTLLEDLPPQDFAQDEYQALLTRQPDNAPLLPLTSYDGSDVSSPFVSRLQESLAAAAVPASGLPSDVASALENPALDNSDWLSAPVDPRDYILAQYLDRLTEATGSDNGSNSMGSIRKIRNSPNSSSSSNSNILSSDSNSNNIDNTNSMSKRGWPHGMTRRRTTGLSLSIDASMKVLREALYLEMARKKQRQQLQRARANQQLLTSIGKRDVQHQLQLQQQEEEEDNNRSDLNHSRAQRN